LEIRIMNKIFTIVIGCGAIGIIVSVILTNTDVLGRFLFNSPIRGTFELTGLLLSIISACSIVAATAADEHIKVDALFERLSPFGQRILRLLEASISIVVFSVLCWQGIVGVRDSMTPTYELSPGLLGIKIYPFRIVLAFGFFLSVVALLYTTIHSSRPKTDVHSEKSDQISGRI
jgi:TRAP-type C4-dicarboxylate transport system permease small subunit